MAPGAGDLMMEIIIAGENIKMKDKHLGMVVLTVICGFCIGYGVEYAKEIVMMSVPVIAAVIRD